VGDAGCGGGGEGGGGGGGRGCCGHQLTRLRRRICNTCGKVEKKCQMKTCCL
jgi:hypothetical protein